MTWLNDSPALVVSSAWISGLARSASIRVRAAVADSDGNSSLRAMRMSSCLLPRRSRLAASAGFASSAARIASEQGQRLRAGGFRVELLRVGEELPARRKSDGARDAHVDDEPLRRGEAHFETSPDPLHRAMRWIMMTTRRASRSLSRSAPPVVISMPASISLRPTTENVGSLRAANPSRELAAPAHRRSAAA